MNEHGAWSATCSCLVVYSPGDWPLTGKRGIYSPSISFVCVIVLHQFVADVIACGAG